MNKKLKTRIVIIIFLLVVIIKIIQINFIENIRLKINKFTDSDSVYSENIYLNNNKILEIFIQRKGNIIKEKNKLYIINYSYIKYIDLNNDKTIKINENYKTYKINKNISKGDSRLRNLPKITEILNETKSELKKGNIFSIFNCIRIIYILPAKYNDIECYKIKTTRELLYVDKQTLYPIYLEYYKNNTNNVKEKIEIEYKFEEREISDEEMKLPNLENYVLIEEN